MNADSPSLEENHDASWLALSLSTVSQPQPQSQPQQYTSPISPPTFQRMPSSAAAPVGPFSSLRCFVPRVPLPRYQPYEVRVREPEPEPQLPTREIPSQQENNHDQETSQSRPVRARRLPVRGLREGKSETITPPYPWATSARATIYSLEHLLSQNMMSITGTVQCKQCEEKYDIAFDLREKFNEVAGFVAENMFTMHNRAPSKWMNPVLPTCNRCGQENSLKPVINKKRTINWLFLLLGQMVGCCKLSHLKYFCKHTKSHRTAAKDRLLYATYLGLCKQLTPDAPFDV